jgi:hypothetical protein
MPLKTDKFAKAVMMAESADTKIEETFIVSPSELLEKPQVEKRSRKVHTYLKPSEYDAFVAQIGRESFSNALRDLVLAFNQQHHEQNP